MFVQDINNVKIYNLSAGKSLPDWLTDRKRKERLKKNVDLKKRIELIQEFDMPGVSTSIKVAKDEQHILATGTYKPRVKCYDVNNLSMKFERCFDSETVTFEILSDDYSKMVFLQCDRYLEFHASHGRHYRLRIPKFGRDMSYHIPSCDLFVVGTSPEIYRLNLERGQFLQPYMSGGSQVYTSEINPEHHLLCVGTKEGTVEAFDPREQRKCNTLDVALKLDNYKQFPSITSLKFKNGLQMAVGTESGHVLLYDIRSSQPLIVKDHFNNLPVKRIEFNSNHNVVYSMDSAMLKIWDETSGKQMAFIEAPSNFNDFATIKNTGMFFFAQEAEKMLTFYIPSLGPAPKWCSFLDNLAEEIESETIQNMYDDYKFLTKQELDELGLDHLIGTNLLRAYMHGFFIDMRLYNKAKAIVDPFAFERYRKEKIRQQIEANRPKRLQINSKLPQVNQDLALKIMDEQNTVVKNKKNAGSLLQDNRFKAMFENPDFQVDKNADEYRLLNPILTRLDKSKLKELKAKALKSQFEEVKDDDENKDSDEELFHEDDSSDDDVVWTKDMKKEIKKVRDEKKQEQYEEKQQEEMNKLNDIKMYEIRAGEEFKVKGGRRKINKTSLGDRISKTDVEPEVTMIKGIGNRQMIFSTEKKTDKADKRRLEEMKKHRAERKQIVRSTNSLNLKKIRTK